MVNKPLEVTIPPSSYASRHPRSYRRKDGKTICPDCHAISLDASALELLQCSTPTPTRRRPQIVIDHYSTSKPDKPLLGDLWKDVNGVIRILTEKVVGDDENGITWTGEWLNIANPDDTISIPPVYSGSEYNEEVVDVVISKELEATDRNELEISHIRYLMHEELMNQLRHHHMMMIKGPSYTATEIPEKDRVTIRVEVLARMVPYH